MKTPSKPVTMLALARAAGVNPSTVSRALRDDPALPAATRHRLQRLAAKRGYRVNPIVAHLTAELRRSRATPYRATLALVHDRPAGWNRHGTWALTLPGLRHRAAQLGYEVEEFSARQLGFGGRRLSEVLRARGIRGVFVAPLTHTPGHLSLDWDEFCAVTLGYMMPRPRLHAVANDHFFSMGETMRWLTRLGYRRIGLNFVREYDLYSGGQYMAAYYVFQQSLPANRRVPVFWSENRGDRWHRDYAVWLRRYRPDAIVSTTAVFLATARQFTDIPSDCGFAALDLFENNPACSGILTQPKDCMAAAVDLLVSQLYFNKIGIPRIPYFTRLEGEWHDGGTTRRQG